MSILLKDRAIPEISGKQMKKVQKQKEEERKNATLLTDDFLWTLFFFLVWRMFLKSFSENTGSYKCKKNSELNDDVTKDEENS